MFVFLDTEFNAHGGDLISLAMVSAAGQEFYTVVELPKKPHPWVKENVIPKLKMDPVGYRVARQETFKWLITQGDVTIVADWPADLIHLLNLMFDQHDPSMAFRYHPKLRLIDTPAFDRHLHALHHNALSDAWVLRDWFMDAYVYENNLEKSKVKLERPLLLDVLAGNLEA